MILAQVEYEAKDWEYGSLVDFRDRLEAVLGAAFEIEQACVDIRMCPYGDLDDFTVPLFIHVLTDDDHDEPVHQIVDELLPEVVEILHATREVPLPDFRLWVNEASDTCVEKRAPRHPEPRAGQ